jgi:uncharacterized damage-inducible protein DinB
MEVKTLDTFLASYKRTREITKRVIAVVPPDKLEWSYMPGKFTIADLIRHIAAIERNVFAQVLSGGSPTYTGCGKGLADGLENITRYVDEMHKQSIEIIASLADQDLTRKIRSLSGKEVELETFLRALATHEIHHRAVLCIYLNMLGISTPPILGFSEQEVIQLSK